MSAGIAFLRGAVGKAAAGALVEAAGDGGAVGLGEVGEAGALGEVLADEAVGVLIGAPLPGVVRGGEVDAGPGDRLEGGVAVELAESFRIVLRRTSAPQLKRQTWRGPSGWASSLIAFDRQARHQPRTLQCGGLR